MPFRQGVSRSDGKLLFGWLKVIPVRVLISVLVVVDRFPAAAPHTLPERQDVPPASVSEFVSIRGLRRQALLLQLTKQNLRSFLAGEDDVQIAVAIDVGRANLQANADLATVDDVR